MLVPLSNAPRDYAWGSVTLLAELEQRAPGGGPEAEVWFGDHPGDPAETPDGTPLDAWLSAAGLAPLPYLLKLLAAASPLSIQAHPSRAQAQAGSEREDAAGIARDAPERTYRDANHKPELIVALSARFRALAGLRALAETRRLLAAIGDATAGLASRLDGSDAGTADALAWLLSPAASDDVRAIIGAARTTSSEEFSAELELLRMLDDRYPADAGVVVALLMNLVCLSEGEGLFVPAGVLHAYLDGLGVEIMAASDNVLRGGLTPKRVDVDELVAVLDPRTGPVAVVTAQREAPGIARYPVPVDDFALRAITVDGDDRDVPVRGAGILLAASGEVVVAGSAETVVLRAGQGLLVTPDEGAVRVSGRGRVFAATPGD